MSLPPTNLLFGNIFKCKYYSEYFSLLFSCEKFALIPSFRIPF